MSMGAIGGALIGGYIMSEASKDAADTQAAAADRATQAAKFDPWNIGGGAFGRATFGDGTANIELTPEMRALQQAFAGQAGQFAQQGQTGVGALALGGAEDFMRSGLQTDPNAIAQMQMGRMDALLDPQRNRTRDALEARLLRQGRLGSTGGALQQQGLETSIDQARQSQALQALQLGQAFQQQQLAQGQQLGLFGQQQQDVGFNQALARLGGMQNIDQAALQYLNLGGAFGGRASQAGAMGGQFGMQGASAGAAAQLGAAQGWGQAANQIGGALGNMNWGSPASYYNKAAPSSAVAAGDAYMPAYQPPTK